MQKLSSAFRGAADFGRRQFEKHRHKKLIMVVRLLFDARVSVYR